MSYPLSQISGAVPAAGAPNGLESLLSGIAGGAAGGPAGAALGLASNIAGAVGGGPDNSSASLADYKNFGGFGSTYNIGAPNRTSDAVKYALWALTGLGFIWGLKKVMK